MTIAIQYPAGLYFYGPFPSVPGMSRPRTIYAGTPAPACPVIVADTADAARRIDAALEDCANFARAHLGGPPPVWIDAAQWLTDREIRHAARLAGCVIVEPDTCAAPDCAAPAMETGPLCHACQSDVMPGPDPAREAASPRWHFLPEIDLY